MSGPWPTFPREAVRGPYDVTLCSLPEGSEATYVDVHRADSHLSNPLSKLSMAFSKDGHGSLAYSDFTRTGERSIADALRSYNIIAATRNQGEDSLLKDREDGRQGELPDLRLATQAVEEGTGATESGTRRRSVRRPDPPPDISGLQTKSQRRRSLPLSQLKRAKPKRIIREEEEEVEYRPLVPKTDRESVLRGEDYWIDFKELDKQAARKKARARAPSPDQFAQSKMRAEIVSPYKQNWILAISIAIVAVAGFIKLNPGILDESIITFPGEL